MPKMCYPHRREATLHQYIIQMIPAGAQGYWPTHIPHENKSMAEVKKEGMGTSYVLYPPRSE